MSSEVAKALSHERARVALARKALDLRGVEAAIECANVISQQAAELEQLRADNAALREAMRRALVDLREDRPYVARSGLEHALGSHT